MVKRDGVCFLKVGEVVCSVENGGNEYNPNPNAFIVGRGVKEWEKNKQVDKMRWMLFSYVTHLRLCALINTISKVTGGL